MIELLQGYTLSEILIFVVILGLAIKGIVSFWDWVVDRFRKAFDKETKQDKRDSKINEHLNKSDKVLEKLSKTQDEYQKDLQKITEKITLLIDSDKDAIKTYITEKHHQFCYEQGWIDDHNLDCLEKRYGHYLAEGGNSYIEDLMTEIRKLPKIPPQNNIKEE